MFVHNSVDQQDLTRKFYCTGIARLSCISGFALVGPPWGECFPVIGLSWEPDILALKHVSRILGHCNNPTRLVSHFQASIWAPNRRRCHGHKPDRKAVLGCCNVREFYWRALEWGYLMRTMCNSCTAGMWKKAETKTAWRRAATR